MAHDLPETAGKAAAPAPSFRKCRRARSIADLPYRSKDVENAGNKTRPRQYPMLLYWNNAIFASINSNLAIGLADANERFPRTRFNLCDLHGNNLSATGITADTGR